MKSLAVVWKRNPVLGACPSCKSLNTLKRSHSRNKKEKLINRLGFYHTFRCRSCGWRGYLSTFSFTLHSLKALLMYAAIIAFAVIITYQVLIRIF